MARKRMIDPMIWQDEEFGSLTPTAKVLFIGLFSNADDEGRIRANKAYLKSTIFMYDKLDLDEVEACRDEVVKTMESVQLYQVNGKEYIQLKNWDEYQKQHKDRIQSSTLPPYERDVTDNVGQVTDNVGLSKDKLSKDILDKDKIDKVSNDKNSDEFSELKKDLGIPEDSGKGVNHEFQAEALRIIKALNISDSRKSAYFKAVKEEPRAYILDAYAYAIDHPELKARDKMFFWKLNELKGAINGKTE